MNPFDFLDPDDRTRLQSVLVQGVAIRAGDRVRLKPRANADIMDLALRDKIGIVEAIEQDFENRIHLAIVVEDDPGRDIGLMRHIGHRFFFLLEEVELVAPVVGS
ncbi:MAG TPA: hypothetical protein VFE24_06175 [Pirellulales bacterium]|jgi:hypothetical protein|nr:hypothetical protein [Pirellulales bacterium]